MRTDQVGSHEPLMFHPVHERGKNAWWPANEAASLVVSLLHTWEDLLRLNDMRLAAGNPYDARLLLRHIVVELYSLVRNLEQLQALVMSVPIRKEGEGADWFSLTEDEVKTARQHFGRFHQEKRRIRLRLLRNNFAHRDPVAWSENMAFWDALEAEAFQPLLDSIRAAFNYVKDLDLYQWVRQPRPNCFHITGPLLDPDRVLGI